MHQQPAQAPRGPNNRSRSSQRAGVTGKMRQRALPAAVSDWRRVRLGTAGIAGADPARERVLFVALVRLAMGSSAPAHGRQECQLAAIGQHVGSAGERAVQRDRQMRAQLGEGGVHAFERVQRIFDATSGGQLESRRAAADAFARLREQLHLDAHDWSLPV